MRRRMQHSYRRAVVAKLRALLGVAAGCRMPLPVAEPPDEPASVRRSRDGRFSIDAAILRSRLLVIGAFLVLLSLSVGGYASGLIHRQRRCNKQHQKRRTGVGNELDSQPAQLSRE